MKTYSLLSEGIRVTIISGDLHFNFTYTCILLPFEFYFHLSNVAVHSSYNCSSAWPLSLNCCSSLLHEVTLLIVLIFLWLTWCFTPRRWCHGASSASSQRPVWSQLQRICADFHVQLHLGELVSLNSIFLINTTADYLLDSWGGVGVFQQ